MIITPKHPFILFSKEFAEICKPLEQFHINHVTYVKQYQDGSRMTVSNKPQWIEDYYNLELYDSSLFESPPVEYPSGFGVWIGEYDLEVYRHGRQYYDTAHSITVTEPVNDGCEFYLFSLPPLHTQATLYLVNHMEILYHFILFFKDKCKNLLNKSEKHRFKILKGKRVSEIQDTLSLELPIHQALEKNKNAFFKATPIHHFSFESGEDTGITLTQREIHCASYLLQNKTAEETAVLMGGLSRRTVESYLENIKLKLDCSSKVDLITKLRNNKFFSAIRDII